MITRVIDEFLCSLLRGRRPKDEEQLLQDWRGTASGNEPHVSPWSRVLNTVSVVMETDDATRRPTAAEIISLADGPSVARIRYRDRFAKRHSVRTLTAAAMIVGLALAGLYYAPDQDAAFRMGSGEYVSGPNETATATLADGTIVRLAPNSRLRILDTPGRREVILSGRAFFVVAHNPDLPFTLRSPAGELEVLGTRFDVSATDELRVVVVEGKVALSAGQDQVEVASGQMSMVTHGGLTQPVTIDVPPHVAWIGRFLAFQETPLREVAKELEQQYGKRVVLSDSKLADLTITGWYIDRTFEEIIALVCGVLNTRCSIRDGTATIGR